MGFKSGLKKALPWINLGAIFAGQLGGDKGKAVAQATGAAVSVVNSIAESIPEGVEGSAPAPLATVLATAAAIDDHQGEITDLKRQLEELRGLIKTSGKR